MKACKTFCNTLLAPDTTQALGTVRRSCCRHSRTASCRLHKVAPACGQDANAVLLLLMRTANQPLSTTVSSEAIQSALKALPLRQPSPDVLPPPDTPSSQRSSHIAYDGAWQEDDALSDWDADSMDSGMPENAAGGGEAQTGGNRSGWQPEAPLDCPPGTPGLARASVAAAASLHTAAATANDALAFPMLPLPYVQTERYVLDQVQHGDLAQQLPAARGHVPVDAGMCFHEAAVAEGCLQMLLVRFLHVLPQTFQHGHADALSRGIFATDVAAL